MMAIPGYNGTLPTIGAGSAEQQPDQDNQISTEFAALLAASFVMPAVTVPAQEPPAANHADAIPVSRDSEGNSPHDSRKATMDGSAASAAGPVPGSDTPAIPAPDCGELVTGGLSGFASLFERSARIPASIPTSADNTGTGAVMGVAGRSLRGFASLFTRSDRNLEPVSSGITALSAGVDATIPPAEPSAAGIVVEAKGTPARPETGLAISFGRLPLPDRIDPAVPQTGDRSLAAEIPMGSPTLRPDETVELTGSVPPTAGTPQNDDPAVLSDTRAHGDTGGPREGSLTSIGSETKLTAASLISDSEHLAGRTPVRVVQETTPKVDDAPHLSHPAASLRPEDAASISARVITTIRNATSTILFREKTDLQDQRLSTEPKVNEPDVLPIGAGDSSASLTVQMDGPLESAASRKGITDKVESTSVEGPPSDGYVASSTKRPRAKQPENERARYGQVRQIAAVSQQPSIRGALFSEADPMNEVSRAESKLEERMNIDQNGAVTHATSDVEDHPPSNRSLNRATADPIASKQPGNSLPSTVSKTTNVDRAEKPGRVTAGMTVDSPGASGFDAPDHEAFRTAQNDTDAGMPIPEKADRAQLKEHPEPGPIQLVQEGLSAKFPEGTKIAGDVQQVARQVAEPTLEAADGLRRNETRSIKVSLRPDELGRVEVEVRRDVNGRVSAVLTADRAESAQLLADGMSGLRQHLEQAGVTIDRLDIYTMPQFQSPGNQSSNSNNPQNSQQEGARNPEYVSANQPNSDGQAAIEEERLLNILA